MDTASFVCVSVMAAVIDLNGAPVQTDPGLIEFSSGLLHVYISRMVIIVWYRLDQFAFNPDFRSREDCGASSSTGQHRDRKRLHSSSDEINISAASSSAFASVCTLSLVQHSRRQDKRSSGDDVKTPRPLHHHNQHPGAGCVHWVT